MSYMPRCLFIITILFAFAAGSAVKAQMEEIPCEGPYQGGAAPSKQDLTEILRKHVDWLALINEYSSKKPLIQKLSKKFGITSWELEILEGIPDYLRKDRRRANFCGADLRDANLQNTKLKFAIFHGSNLSGAHLNKADLHRTDFRNAHLGHTNFTEAKITYSDFRNAFMDSANFTRANLTYTKMNDLKVKDINFKEADLTGADLSNVSILFAHFNSANLKYTILNNGHISFADFSNSELISTRMANSQFFDAVMSQTVFEPDTNWKPDIINVKTWKKISGMTYQTSPHALVSIRKVFKEAGLREEERQITYAIWRTKRERAPIFEGTFLFILFELPSSYGLYPGLPLKWLVGLFLICGFVYLVPILEFPANPMKHPGIFRDWAENRVRKDFGTNKPERLSLGGWRAIPYAFYFSLLSAFHIGWRDLNVGNWIARIQPREYSLRATGWVRVVSGAQSLISVYLMALWALTYFGRPFE